MSQPIPRLFWLIFAAYFVLAGIYATITPPFEKPDENWHYAATMYIMETGSLPQNTATSPDHYALQQANQPPLYYFTLAAVWHLSGFDTLTPGYLALAKRNEQVRLLVPAIHQDNRRLFVQGRCEGACTQALTAMYVGRALSVVYVGASLIFSVLALRRIFPQRPGLLLLTVALIAFNPQVLHIGTSVSNDSLVILMMSVGFYLAAHWLTGARDRRMVIVMGVVAGAALLAKLSGAVLGLLFGLLLLATSKRRGHDVMVFGVVSLVVCGWWLVYNTLVYGDPTAVNVHIRSAPQRDPPETIAALLVQLPTVARSYWAEFGWGNIPLHNVFYGPIIVLLVAGGMAGAFYFAMHGRMWTSAQRGFLLLSTGAIVMIFALLLRWMSITQAPHGRLLFPAVLPVALFVAAGWLGFVPRRGRVYAAGAFGVGLLSFAVWTLVQVIAPAYAPPPPVVAPQPGAALVRFDEAGGGMVSLHDIVLVEAAHRLYVQLSWQINTPLNEDYLVFVHALNADEQIIAQRDSYPGLSNRPFTRIETGDVFHDVYPLPRPAEPVTALRIGVYSFDSVLQTWTRLDAESTGFAITDNAVLIPRAQVRRPQGAIRFLGSDG